MPRPTPTRDHAAGMLHALTQHHTCGLACTATITRGDGSRITLRCPWEQLDLTNPADRRIVQGVYANEAHAMLMKAA